MTPSPNRINGRRRVAAATNLVFWIALVGLSCLLVVSCAAPKAEVITDTGDALSLAFSSFVGGSNDDSVRDVALDAQGNAYITGGTNSPDFKTTPGVYDETHNGLADVFVAKIAPDGQLLWSTVVGGPNNDRAYAIEVDNEGHIYLAGRAGDGFPTTPSALQPDFAGDDDVNQLYGPQDGFVTKLTPDGSAVVWSTYFGARGREIVRDIDIDDAGQVVLGLTSVSEPVKHVTPDAFQAAIVGGYDGVVAKLSADGSQILWATYLGGSGSNDTSNPSIRVDTAGNVYVLGETNSPDMPTTAEAFDRTLDGDSDLHLSKFSPSGDFIFGTYLGGSDAEFTETHHLALDRQGNPVVAATTLSSDFPVTSGVFQTTYGGSGGANSGRGTNYPGDGIIASLSSDGSRLLASTFFGGRHGEGIEGVDIDAQGNIFVSGATFSDDLTVSADAFQPMLRGRLDFFVAKLSPDLGQLLYATYLGGDGLDAGRTAAVNAGGDLLVGGEHKSEDWPTLKPIQPSSGGNLEGAFARFVPAFEENGP